MHLQAASVRNSGGIRSSYTCQERSKPFSSHVFQDLLPISVVVQSVHAQGCTHSSEARSVAPPRAASSCSDHVPLCEDARSPEGRLHRNIPHDESRMKLQLSS